MVAKSKPTRGAPLVRPLVEIPRSVSFEYHDFILAIIAVIYTASAASFGADILTVKETNSGPLQTTGTVAIYYPNFTA